MVHGVLPLEPVSVCHPRNRRGGRSALSAVPSAGVAPRVVGGVAHGAQYAACGELVALVASLSGGSHGESVGQRGQRESSPCVPTAWSRPVTVTARPLQGCGMPAGTWRSRAAVFSWGSSVPATMQNEACGPFLSAALA